MRVVLVILALFTLYGMKKTDSSGGLVEWTIIILGFIAAIIPFAVNR